MATSPPTLPVEKSADTRRFARFVVEVTEGNETGKRWDAGEETCSIGTAEDNTLCLTDPTVSRYHCEISVAGGRLRVRDLGSRNGTRVGTVHIADASVPPDTELRLGHTRLRTGVTGDDVAVETVADSSFGSLVGESPAMREMFAKLARAAATDATVLLEGETGTGKEGAADALHEQSSRRSGPLVVFDCGAVPPNLIEAELFGHEAGAFTGATGARAGAFEEASGGTLFLDEVGELALDLQPKLLRALESRRVRRIGSRKEVDCDVRLVAATNRDLRSEVNDGRFRADLYYRLAVVRIMMPPLRARAGDLKLLSIQLLRRLGAADEDIERLTTPEFLAVLARASWPGNVRELRNHLEHCLVMQVASAPENVGAQPTTVAAAVDAELPYDEARRHAIERFERAYVEALLAANGGQVAKAAMAAGMNRAYLYRLVKRYALS